MALCTAADIARADDAEGATGFDLTLERAMELQDAGSHDAALQIYRSLRDDRPDDPRLLYEMARASLSAGDHAACWSYTARSVAYSSRYQAPAYGLMARCQQRAGESQAALNTWSSALEHFPGNATLHFDYALALRTQDHEAAASQFASALQLAVSQPDLYLAYARVLETDAQSGGALLMNLRYIMAAPQSPAAMGAAEQILKALDADAARSPRQDPLAAELLAARKAASVATGASNTADRLNRFLQTFMLGVVATEDPEVQASPVWSGGVEPLLVMADNDVLDTFLHFVGALARTEGSPEWLSAHRPQFERLVEYLAKQGTT